MQLMFSVSEFCHAHGISRALFYRLAKSGQGPKMVKIGRRTLINAEAAAEWRRELASVIPLGSTPQPKDTHNNG
jgi:predicted DNA-binding transcriptional regulator AlpA